MDPPRFELTTPGLQDQSSTTELNLGIKFFQKIETEVNSLLVHELSSFFWQNFLPRLSSVVELWSCKPGVVSSNRGGSIVILVF